MKAMEQIIPGTISKHMKDNKFIIICVLGNTPNC